MGDMWGQDHNPQRNYFTCTLGEAAEIKANQPSEFKTVETLIDLQACRNPNLPAVAFATPVETSTWKHEVFSSFSLNP